MGERFVVVPVDGGGGVAGEDEHSDAVVSDPAPDTGSGGREEEKEAGEDSVFEQQDPNAVVPILEYNREPNKYGDIEREAHGVKMPTNFTVVPVKDNTRKAKEGDEEDDVDDNNVLKEEEGDTTGPVSFPIACFLQKAVLVCQLTQYLMNPQVRGPV
eukprot:superscaffoldBa00000680_g6533